METSQRSSHDEPRRPAPAAAPAREVDELGRRIVEAARLAATLHLSEALALRGSDTSRHFG